VEPDLDAHVFGDDPDEDDEWYRQYLVALRSKKERNTVAAIFADPVDDAIVEPAPKIAIIPPGGISSKAAKKYIPSDYVITWSNVREPYWQTRHKSGKPSFAKGCTDNSGLSKNQAMAYCIRHAWRQHRKDDGKEEMWTLQFDGDL